MRSLGADPALVGIWVRGWVVSRNVAAPEPDHGAWRVEVGLREQQRRFVFPAIAPGLGELAASVEQPWVFLKACAPEAAIAPWLPPRWTIQTPGFMMVRPRQRRARGLGTLDGLGGYRLEYAGGVRLGLTATIMRGGRHLRRQRPCLALVQDHAIYDRIVTHEDHRRRGLGRAVIMATLDRLAHENAGARHGVLVATPARPRTLHHPGLVGSLRPTPVRSYLPPK